MIDLRGEISLLEFAALLSKSDIIISNDSAPVHIGSAFEKPFIIGIFGPGKRALGFFPWTEKSVVIEDNNFYENSITAVPEKQHTYSKDYYKGIPEITVDRVYKEDIKSSYNETFEYTDVSFKILDTEKKDKAEDREVDDVVLKRLEKK